MPWMGRAHRLGLYLVVAAQLCNVAVSKLSQSNLRYNALEDTSYVDAWDADQVATRWSRAQAPQQGADPMFMPALGTDFSEVAGGGDGETMADRNLDHNLNEMSERTEAGLSSDAETRDLAIPYFEPGRTLQTSFDVNAADPEELPTGGFGENLQLAENVVAPKGGGFEDNLQLASNELMSDSKLRGNLHRVFVETVPASMAARPAPPKGKVPITIWDAPTSGSAASAVWDMPIASGISFDAPLVTKQFDVGTLS